MPVIVGETVYSPPAPQVPPRNPPRKLWTRAECEACERAGLWKGQHDELIEGELIIKMPTYLLHGLGVWRVCLVLARIFGSDRILPVTSMDVAAEDDPTSRPEPDAIDLKRSSRELTGVVPKSSDAALVVEVSDSTLDFDLTTKAALYARADIPEYWVVDLNGCRLIVDREPLGGVYKSVVAYSDAERVAPLSAPGQEMAAADLLAA